MNVALATCASSAHGPKGPGMEATCEYCQGNTGNRAAGSPDGGLNRGSSQYEAKVSRTVPRGGGGRKATFLPGYWRKKLKV